MTKLFRNTATLLVFLLLLCTGVEATHIVGGEMNYRQTGAGTYEITLLVYRDCFGGQAPFDDPASIGIFDSNGDLYSTAMVDLVSVSNIPNNINTPCLTAPTNICYQVGTYIYTTTLPPRAGGYQIVYQRCCRNSSVLNIYNVRNTGATYIATIPDPALAAVNSNPEFNLLPPTFICQGAPFTFNHAATDPDGDSIVYEICTPLDGADPFSPQPQPPSGPPYQNIVWQTSYSVLNSLGGVPLKIDPRTGILTATPSSLGQFVYGVCAKEYRNGVYLGETKRDFQVNVVPCPMITVASIFSPTIVCGSLTAEFTNNSYNADTYAWKFGDPSSVFDTSSLKDPDWTYPDTGEYHVRLIAYSGVNSLCNDTAYGVVNVYPVFYAGYSIINDRCSPEFNFSDASFGIGGASNFWDWDFGDGTKSSVANPSHTFQQPGLYDVTFIASTDSACLDTVTKTISVLQNPVSQFSTVLDTCAYLLKTLNQSSYANESVWNFNGSWTGPSEQPEFQFENQGVHKVQMVAITDSLCTDTSSALIYLPPLPEADFQYDVNSCDSVVQFQNLSVFGSHFEWTFGDGDTSSLPSPRHTYELAGHVPVKLITTSVNQCRDTLEKNIYFVSYKVAAFSTFIDSCAGSVSFKGVTDNAVTYHWDFGDGQESSVKNPVHSYSTDGLYLVSLTVNGEGICRDSVSLFADFESPLGEKLFVPTAFTPNGDGLNDVFKISVFKPCEQYSISIFNRWGQLVFQAEDAQEAIWDGTFNNSMAEEGVYVYLLKGDGHVKKGVAYLTR